MQDNNKLIKQADYYFVDAASNSDKFWTIILQENDDCTTLWGRNGTTGQSKIFLKAGRSFFADKCNEKKRKGYQLKETIEWSDVKNGYVKQFFTGEQTKNTAKKMSDLVGEGIDDIDDIDVPVRKKVKKEVKSRYQLPQPSKRKFNLELE